MRLSEWQKTAPSEDSLSSRVLAILKPVLVDMGAEADADCWVCWGDDPEMRYSILAPTIAGLVDRCHQAVWSRRCASRGQARALV